MRVRELAVGDRVLIHKPYEGGTCIALIVSTAPLRAEPVAGYAKRLPDPLPARWVVRKAAA